MGWVLVLRVLLRIGIAVVVAGVLSIVLFLFFGAALPVWAMIAIYGRQAVQDAPGHGGLILFATLPIAAVIGVPTFFLLTVSFFDKLQSRGLTARAAANGQAGRH